MRLARAAAFVLLAAGLAAPAAASAPVTAAAQPQRAVAARASASNSLREWWFAPKGAHRRPGIPATAARLVRTYAGLWIGPRRDKVVYLTFDEAYEMGTTARIVGILDRAHVKATFFVTGQYVRANPALTRRLAAHGEVVGNHTGTHADMVLKARDRSAFNAELRATERAYRAATGRPLARIFRPPFGRYSARVLQLAGELGYTTVFWSFAHGDYDDDSQPPASVTLKRILDAGYPGALYLLHASSRSNVAALARAIRGLKARGFRFGTLDELAAVCAGLSAGTCETTHEGGDGRWASAHPTRWRRSSESRAEACTCGRPHIAAAAARSLCWRRPWRRRDAAPMPSAASPPTASTSCSTAVPAAGRASSSSS